MAKLYIRHAVDVDGIHFRVLRSGLLGRAPADVDPSGWSGSGHPGAALLALMVANEAAAVDGASRLGRIVHVSVPGIMPVIVLVTMLNIGNLLSAGFEQVFIFYNPSVYNVADIIGTWVYREGIQGFQYSVAAAVGLFQGFVGLILLAAANWAGKRWAGAGIW